MTADTNINVTPGDVYPTEANDTFNSTAARLQDSIIDGVGGNNELNISSIRAAGPYAPASISNIQVVNMAGRANDSTIGASDFTDVEEWWSNGSQLGNLVVDNVSELGTVGMNAGHDDILYQVNFTGGVTTGENEVSIVLDNVVAREDNGAALSVDGFETFNIQSSGETSLSSIGRDTDAAADDEVTTLNIEGDGDLTLGTDETNADLRMGGNIRIVDAEEFTGNLSVIYGQSSATTGTGVHFAGGSGTNEVNLTQIQNTANNDAVLDVDGGDGDSLVSVGAILNMNPGAVTPEITLDGGDGTNELHLIANDTGANDLGGLLNQDDVNISNFQKVQIALDGANLSAFSMDNFEGADEFVFAAESAQNVLDMDATGYEDIFELGIYGYREGGADDVGNITVNNIGESTDQDSLTVSATADLDEGEFVTNNSNAEMGNLNLNGAAADDGISELDIVSNFDEDLDDDDLAIGSLADVEEFNTLNNITSEDGPDDEMLESVSMNAEMNLMVNGFQTYAGTAGEQSSFNLNLNGAALINAGAITPGAEVNVLNIENEGTGDRVVTLAADGGLKDGDHGEGVQISDDGETGNIIFQGAQAQLNTLEVNAEQADGDVYIRQTDAGTTDAENMTGYNAYVFATHDTDAQVDNLEAGVRAEVVSDAAGANNNVTIDQLDADQDDEAAQEVVLGNRFEDSDGIEIDTLTINDVEHITITGLDSDDNSPHTIATLAADALRTLTIDSQEEDDAVEIANAPDDISGDNDSQTFTLTTTGSGSVDIGNTTAIGFDTNIERFVVDGGAAQGTEFEVEADLSGVNVGREFWVEMKGDEEITADEIGATNNVERLIIEELWDSPI